MKQNSPFTFTGDRPKVLVIGWDGADWGLLHPMMSAGVLPNLEAFLKKALTGDLLSTIPPATASAWSSFFTGLQPGRHGLITWQGPLNTEFERPLLNAGDIHGTRLWHRLGNAGKKVFLLNVPLTYPPEAVNGIMVSGMLTPNTEVQFTYPDDVRDLLCRVLPVWHPRWRAF